MTEPSVELGLPPHMDRLRDLAPSEAPTPERLLRLYRRLWAVRQEAPTVLISGRAGWDSVTVVDLSAPHWLGAHPMRCLWLLTEAAAERPGAIGTWAALISDTYRLQAGEDGSAPQGDEPLADRFEAGDPNVGEAIYAAIVSTAGRASGGEWAYVRGELGADWSERPVIFENPLHTSHDALRALLAAAAT